MPIDTERRMRYHFFGEALGVRIPGATPPPEVRTLPTDDPRGGPVRDPKSAIAPPSRLQPPTHITPPGRVAPPARTQPPEPPDPVGDPPGAFNGQEPTRRGTMPIRTSPTIGGPGATWGTPTFPFQQTTGGIFDPFVERAGSYCREIGIPDWLCATGEAAAGRWLGGDSGAREGGASPGSTTLVGGPASCPEGWIWNPQTGQCDTAGITGRIQRAVPGGQTGTLADVQGQAVVGAFGIPGMMPRVVGTRMDARGNTNPILECPTGLVLGRDNICYMKSALKRNQRKWPPRRKPPVSASDARAINQADRARNRVKRLAQKSGFACRKR